MANSGPGKWFSTGDPTGLYHLVAGEGQNAFIANGTLKPTWNFSDVDLRYSLSFNAQRSWRNKSLECQCVHAGRPEDCGMQALAERDKA